MTCHVGRVLGVPSLTPTSQQQGLSMTPGIMLSGSWADHGKMLGRSWGNPHIVHGEDLGITCGSFWQGLGVDVQADPCIVPGGVGV